MSEGVIITLCRPPDPTVPPATLAELLRQMRAADGPWHAARAELYRRPRALRQLDDAVMACYQAGISGQEIRNRLREWGLVEETED